MAGRDPVRERARIERFLSHGPVTVTEGASGAGMLLDGGDRGTVSVDRAVLKDLIRTGSVRLRGGMLCLSTKAQLAGEGAAAGFQNQHRDLDTATIDTEAGPDIVTVNWAESPLAQLMRRKAKDGAAFLNGDEFRAGERLRADFTRGQMMPRLGANWIASVASGRRDGGIGDLTDAALGARLRVEKAIIAVGPELSGILIDVCCFLKGMETVEIERGWPARSAKVVLKAALGALGRHYDPGSAHGGRSHPQVLHWGAGDYRPSIGA